MIVAYLLNGLCAFRPVKLGEISGMATVADPGFVPEGILSVFFSCFSCHSMNPAMP